MRPSLASHFFHSFGKYFFNINPCWEVMRHYVLKIYQRSPILQNGRTTFISAADSGSSSKVPALA